MKTDTAATVEAMSVMRTFRTFAAVAALADLNGGSAQETDGSILQIVVLRDVVGLHRRFALDQSLSNPSQTKFYQRP